MDLLQMGSTLQFVHMLFHITFSHSFHIKHETILFVGADIWFSTGGVLHEFQGISRGSQI